MKKFSFKAHLFSMGLLFSGIGAFAQNSVNIAAGVNYVDLGATSGALGTGAFTAEAYFKTSGVSTAILSNRANSCSSACSQYWNLIINAAGEIQFEVSADALCTNYNSITSTSPKNDGTWHHVAVTRSGTTLTMYIDGVQNTVATLGAAAANVNSGLPLTIGNNNNPASCPSAAISVDEVRIWNRALQACEINNNRLCELVLPQNSLRSYYKLNDGAASVADLGSNASPGTLTGTITWAGANATPISGTCGVAIPTVTLTPSPASTCQGTDITLTATPSIAGSTFQWAASGTNLGTAATQVASGATVGSTTYSVTVTAPSGCTVTGTRTVTVNAIPTATVTPATTPTAICAGTSTTLTAASSIAGSTFQWFKDGASLGVGATSATYAANAAGSYTVTATRSGCTSAASNAVVVTINPAPAVPTITSATSTTICAGDNVLLNTSTVAGATYQWQLAAADITGATSASYMATAAGAYTVKVTVAGCSSTSVGTTVTVNAKPVPVFTIPAPNASTICPGGSTVINVEGSISTGPYTFVWDDASTAFSRTVTPTVTTTYTVTVTDANGCKAVASQIITVRTAANTTITPSGSTTICSGSSVDLTAPTATGVTYTWKRGVATVGTAQTYTASVAGSYTVDVTDANCTTTSAPTVVTVNQTPTSVAAAGGPTTFCVGGSVTLTGTTDIGTVWEWRKDGVTIPGATASTYSATTAGSYTAIAIAATGCAKSSLPIAVSTNALPPATITGSSAVCTAPAAATTLSANTGTGLTYQWKLAGATVGTAATYAANAGGSYTVVVTDANGCVATSTAKVLTQYTGQATSLTGNATVCQNLTTPYAVTPNDQVRMTFVWKKTVMAGTPPAPVTTTLTDTAKVLQVGSVGDYTVMVTDSNGCITTATRTLTTVFALPTVAVAPTAPTAFCQGGSVTLTATPGAGLVGTPVYAWKNGATAVGANATTYAAITSGQHTVEITDGNGCKNTSNASTVTVNPLPNALVSGAGTVCQGINQTLTANAADVVVAGTTYQWYKTGTLISTNGTSQTYTVLPTVALPLNTTDAYTVRVTSPAGCITTSTGFTFTTINPLPTAPIAANGAVNLCPGATVILDGNPTALAGQTYQWQKGGVNVSGATASTYTVTPATVGAYTVIVTNTATGCSKTSNTLNTGTATPVTATVTASAGSVCAGTSLLTATATGTGLTYQWQKDGADVAGATTATHTPASAGSYTVVVNQTGTAGCATTSAATAVSAVPAATATAAGLTNVCQNSSDILNANTGTGLTYQWRKDGVNIPAATNATATTANLTFNQTGAYTVVVTNAGGCAATSTPAINVTMLPTPGATVTAAGATTVCSPATVSLTGAGAGAGAGLIYEWEKDNSYIPIVGATSATYAAATSGLYKVFITNVSGCTDSAEITVKVKALPHSNVVTVFNNACVGQVDTLKAPIAPVAVPAASYTYQWYSSATGVLPGTLIAAPVGTDSIIKATDAALQYRVVVSLDGCAAASSTYATPAFNALPTSAAITPQTTTAFCSPATVILDAPAGATSYQWNKDGAAITGQTGASYTASTTGAYTVTVKNAAGCALTTPVATAVTVNARPTAVVTPAGPTGFCTGGSVVLNANTGAGLTYQWRVGGAAIPGATAASYTASAAGTYDVMITNSNPIGGGCTNTSGTTVVTNGVLPVATVVGATNTFCAGDSVTLTANAGAGLTYEWLKGGVVIADSTRSILKVRTAGVYTVRTSDGGCKNTATPAITVVVNALPAVTTATPTTFCAGNSVVLNAPASGAYQWKLNGADIAGATAATFNANSLSSDATATKLYSVAYTAGGTTCISTATTVTVNANPIPVLTAGGALTQCEFDSIQLTIGGGGTYKWTTPYAWTTGSTASQLMARPGAYTVTVTNTAGCTAVATETVNQINAPSAVVTVTGSQNFCLPGSVNLLGVFTLGATYSWKKADGTEVSTSRSYTTSVTGVYTFTVKDGSPNTCKNTSVPYTVNAYSAPVATVTSGAALCPGGTTTLTAAPAGAGYTYQWYKDGSAIAAASGATYAANAAGSYTVSVTNGGIGACSNLSATPAVVTVSTPAVPTITAPSTAFCTGGNAVLTSSSATGNQWYFNNTLIPAATAATYTATAAGVYTVATTYASGCTATSAATTTTINAPPAAVLVAGGPTAFCAGGNVTLNANTGTGLTYQWLNGGTPIVPAATGASYVANAAGSYSVKVTDANTCTSTSSATSVVVNATPTATATANGAPTTFCPGGNVLLSANAGAASYQWLNNGATIAGATSSTYTANAAGSYSVIVSSGAACTATSTGVAVAISALPTAAITAASATTFCSGNSVALNANTGTGLTYVWKNNNVNAGTGASFTASAAGAYTVVVTDGATGCSNTSTATNVTVNALPGATIAATGTTFCQGGSATLNANTGTGLTYVWSNNGATIAGANAASYTTNAAGSYTVAVTNTNGCTSPSTATAVTVLALPTATIVAGGPISFCAGGNVTLNANGGAGLSYQWRNNGTAIAGANTSAYVASTSGSYTVAVTNGSGCQNISAPTAVSANAAPSATVTTVSPTTFCQGGNVVLSAPAAAGSSYQWLKNGANIATGANYVANTSGAYTVIVTDANGCVATSTSTSVTVNALPTATITAVGNTTLCQGDNVTLNVTGGTSYAWSTSSTATSITVSTAGAYSVTVTNAAGCTAAATQQVSVNTLPVATSAAGGATTFCAGGSVALNANTGTGLSYQWLNNGTSIAGANAATYAANAAGAYTVVVTAANGCRNTSNATTVTVNAAPVPALTTSRSPNLCPGDNVTLTIAGGTSYLWSTGVTTTTVVASTAGNYTVTVTNAAGCTATTSQAVVVNALPLSTITAGGLTSFCPGDNVALSAPVGNNYTYQWRNNTTAIAGATSRTYAANAVGSYTAVVTDAVTGCSSTSATPIAVTVFTKPTVSFTRTIQTGTTSVVDFANTSTAGTAVWSFGDALNSTSTQQNPTFWYRTAGTYTVKLKVTNSNGCVDSLVQTVTVTIRTDLSELEETLKAVAYPNPFSDRLVIEVQNPQVAFSNNDRLVVTNGLGQIVHTAAFNQKMIEISTTEWAAGIYNLTIYSNGKVIPMKKVVKIAQ